MSNGKRMVGLTLGFSLALGLGCTPPVVDPVGASTPVGSAAPGAVVASATLGVGGGTLVSADGRVTLVIPAGALPGDTMLSVAPITNNAHGGIGAAYRMTGAETFAQPVSLAFSYLDEELAGTAPQFLDVAFQTQDGFWQLANTVTLDDAAKTITATTTHFTDWSFVARFRLEPAVAKLKVDQGRVFQIEHSYPIHGKRARSADDAPLLGFGWTLVSAGYGGKVASGWAVDGIAGGNATIGTIYADVERGGYAAPEKKPSPDTVTVSVKVTNPLDAADNGRIVAQVTIIDDSSKYSGSFGSTLNSTDVNYTVTGMVVWEPSGPETFRPAGTGQITYSAKCGADQVSFGGSRNIITSGAGAGVLKRFPSLGYYTFSFGLEPFEVSCNGVAVPINILINPCDNFGTLLIKSGVENMEPLHSSHSDLA